MTWRRISFDAIATDRSTASRGSARSPSPFPAGSPLGVLGDVRGLGDRLLPQFLRGTGRRRRGRGSGPVGIHARLGEQLAGVLLDPLELFARLPRVLDGRGDRLLPLVERRQQRPPRELRQEPRRTRKVKIVQMNRPGSTLTSGFSTVFVLSFRPHGAPRQRAVSVRPTSQHDEQTEHDREDRGAFEQEQWEVRRAVICGDALGCRATPSAAPAASLPMPKPAPTTASPSRRPRPCSMPTVVIRFGLGGGFLHSILLQSTVCDLTVNGARELPCR